MDFAPAISDGPAAESQARLFGIAYRMLGDVQEAQDIVQEAYLRWHQADQSAIASQEAWLVTVTTRLSIDRLRHLATERAAYYGSWLPEPIAAGTLPAPERAVEQSSELSMALLVLLERLTPDERAAFILRDVFDTDYAEIAEMLGKQVPAVRQMIHRARERVRGEKPRTPVAPAVHERLVHRFLDVLAADDREGLLALLAPDVVMTTDGGGKVFAAPRPIHGIDRIERLLVTVERKFGSHSEHRLLMMNGEAAIASYTDGQLYYVTAIETDGDRIVAFYRVFNPDKLRYIPARIDSGH